MADSRTPIKSSLIASVFFLFAWWMSASFVFAEEPVDSVKSDTLQAMDEIDEVKVPDDVVDIDSAFIGPIDQSIFEEVVNLPPPPPFQPYYDTYITQKGIDDILRYRTGIFMLQHGAVGHPSIIVKSMMLPGINTIYNGVPVFHQGSYFPVRSATDLVPMMSDNIAGMEITPLSHLKLFSEGEVLSLQSTIWPSEDNPSSISHARGAYDYERTTWRFSRRFTEEIAATFTAAFKEYSGYYTSGDDYDDFRLSGSAAWRPKTDIELRYQFYQHKARQGLVQFDRIVTPTTRSHNDLNFHTLKAEYQHTDRVRLTLDAFYQQNYNNIYDNTHLFSYITRDQIRGMTAGIELSMSKHYLTLNAGLEQQKLDDVSSYNPVSTTTGLLVSDSIYISDNQTAVLAGRFRHNNKDDFKIAGIARYRLKSFTLSAGSYDSSPDLYARYFSPPVLDFGQQNFLATYTYTPDPGLESKNTVFGSGSLNINLFDGLSANLGVAYEQVTNDLVYELSSVDSVFTSTQLNTDYDRLTFTADLDYNLTRFFSGRTGVTYFRYDPSEALPGIKHSPSLVAFSIGELKIREVLRDIDISGAFQARYYSKRYYEGFVNSILGRTTYKKAIVVDGSLAIRFAEFEFRISEDNITDFFTQNNYNLWGEYTMPPAAIWWQFTWNFNN